MTNRELDAEIAKHVFGYGVGVKDDGIYQPFYYLEDASMSAVPAYSTEMGWAWKVVDKMKDRGWKYELKYDVDEYDECSFYKPPRHNYQDCYSSNGEGKSPEHAICLAALNAHLTHSQELK